LIIVSCVIGGVGGLGLTTTLSLSALERRREMGVMRAIGASPSMIWFIVATEGVVIGVLSWALAALLAWPLGRVLGNILVGLMFKSDMNFSFDPAGLLIWLAVSIFVGAAASFLPAWRASRRSVREAIGYE
jgi:putative ABC transport system permease protein